MLERVVHTIARHNMFQTGQRVGVAVSGGADSVCLLHILFELAPRWNLHLSVLHLDHQLRGEESLEDARFVRALAEKFSLPFHLGETGVRRAALESGDNLEQSARKARRQFFMQHLQAGAADRVATGHTRSDQAETVLFRFLRGSGTAGLAGVQGGHRAGLRGAVHDGQAQLLEAVAQEGGGLPLLEGDLKAAVKGKARAISSLHLLFLSPSRVFPRLCLLHHCAVPTAVQCPSPE